MKTDEDYKNEVIEIMADLYRRRVLCGELGNESRKLISHSEAIGRAMALASLVKDNEKASQ